MNISHYLDQLLEDIEALMERKPPCKDRVMPVNGSKVLLKEFVMDLNEHILEDKGPLVCGYTGISVDYLPESAMLSDVLLELLYSGVINLLNHYQFYPEFHESVPIRACYEKLREEWEGIKIPQMDYGHHDRFCDHDESDCPFPGVCKGCLENDDAFNDQFEWEEEEERDDDGWGWNEHR